MTEALDTLDTQGEETLEVPLAELRPALEAVLMVADQPLDAVSLATAVGYPVSEVVSELQLLAEEYAEQGRGFELRNVAGGWRYYTREDFAPVVEKFVLEGQQARLTQAALETLEETGWRAGELTKLTSYRPHNGTSDAHFHLYRTSSYFLERIGINSIEELPELAPFLPTVEEFADESEVASPNID